MGARDLNTEQGTDPTAEGRPTLLLSGPVEPRIATPSGLRPTVEAFDGLSSRLERLGLRPFSVAVAVAAVFIGFGGVIGIRYLSIFAVPGWAASWLAVLVLVVGRFRVWRRARAARRWAMATLLLATSFALSCGTFLASAHAERALATVRARRSLPGVLARAASLCPSPGTVSTVVGGRTVFIDCGPPTRVAFPLPGGWLDNWSAIVFDPTEEIGSIPEPRPTIQSTPHRLRDLFGGDITTCLAVRPGYYYCSFT